MNMEIFVTRLQIVALAVNNNGPWMTPRCWQEDSKMSIPPLYLRSLWTSSICRYYKLSFPKVETFFASTVVLSQRSSLLKVFTFEWWTSVILTLMICKANPSHLCLTVGLCCWLVSSLLQLPLTLQNLRVLHKAHYILFHTNKVLDKQKGPVPTPR